MTWHLRRSIREMSPLPRGYGVAYYDPCCAEAICYPIPLNQIVGAWRALLLWLIRPHFNKTIDGAYRAGIAEGIERRSIQATIELKKSYDAGWRDGVLASRDIIRSAFGEHQRVLQQPEVRPDESTGEGCD